MSDFRDIISFINSGLNYDDFLEVLPQGDGRYRLNIDPTETSGVLTNMKGNSKVSTSLPAGTNKVLGYCYDRESNAGIYFLYNSNNNHGIYKYNKEAGTISAIITNNSYLNFQSTSPVFSRIIGDGSFKMIYWVDGTNPPRKLNLDQADGFTFSATNYDQILDIIKHPPSAAPVLDRILQSDTTKEFNLIKQNVFQFAYAYHYSDDKCISSFSPTSTITIPFTVESGSGEYLTNLSVGNYIGITLSGTETDVVDKLYLYYRLGNTRDWYLYDKITNTGASITYNFFNDKLPTEMDQSTANRPFDYVPQISGSLEVVNSNRLMLGDNTEGYDDVTPSVALSLQGPVLPYEGYPEETLTVNTTSHASPARTRYCVLIDQGDPGPPSNYDQAYTYYKFVIDIVAAASTYQLEKYQPFYTDNKDLIDDFVTEILVLGDANIYTASRVDYYLYVEILDSASPKGVTGIATNISPRRKIFKSGAFHQFGFVYYDRVLRSGGVNYDDNMRIYFPYDTDDFEYKSGLRMTISHQPLEEAIYWAPVYSKNVTMTSFFQVLIRGFGHANEDITYDATTNLWQIDINRAINAYRAERPNTNLGTYSYSEGDKLRILAFWNSGTTSTVSGSIPFTSIANPSGADVTEFYELDIIGTDGSNFVLGATGASFPYSETDFNAADFYLIEVYTPRITTEDMLYYEIGTMRAVNNPGESNRSHSCWTVDQVYPGTPGQITYNYRFYGGANYSYADTSNCEKGDVYQGYRYDPENDVYYIIEDMNYAEFKDSDETDIGRANAILTTRQQRLNTIRYGGVYIDNADVNFISQFEYASEKRLDDKAGRIKRLLEEGYSLNVIQEKKVTSIWVGVQEIYNADGSSSLTTTDSVLGQSRPLMEDFGTLHADSVVKSDRNIYYFDWNNSQFIRKAPNGQQVISDLKMSKWFEEKVVTLLASGVANIDVISSFDTETQIVFVTFIDRNTAANSETIGFHEPSNRWVSFYSFLPEKYGNIGKTFISFKDGELYLHNSDAVNRCYFYGVQYGAEVWIVINGNPNFVKTFDNISIHSNKQWTAPDDDSIILAANNLYTNGMQSKLRSGDFRLKEGVYHAAFLRDLLTKGSTPNDFYLFNGRKLRGREMTVKLENADTSEAKLFLVEVTSSRSG